eukprot:NODE_2185_length_629_cov_187.665339_g2135_i0.p1 GENE.NODE_2185_length_629_cov_187.665339_g2135_i0~~NODE_2185_length_629_cov_187.665339_g2135_i0.p1  ORF type:complete len:116 (+),score=17.11 NODE_2185_length_629_cov_187.665339_g2135_i0:85-432(+)
MQVERLRPDSFLLDVQRESVQQIIRGYSSKIQYSERYSDDTHEYRHVILPSQIAKLLPKPPTNGTDYLLSEREWRSIGVQQSLGWEHYLWHRPELHVLLFKRPKGYQAGAVQTRA